ncbi:alpha/beta-hydrolase [Saccharata proteae CBS 121410]|uniref:Alpha/beta-hydrolase n=1 Tax=Saccharata proteae CBS 121410 TaxID=1314787 RepID=A0A6A5YC93_9PEZI|nr:alpha/beta-hydrolase [Saccharata proteae CBS 121410]
MTLLAILINVTLILSFTRAALARTQTASINVPYKREYFYTGGQYVLDASGSFTFRGQMYVEHLTPIGEKCNATSLVFIHGQGQTGTNWLNKPDGQPGWATYFLASGYDVYIVDQPFRGRSPWTPRNLSDTLDVYNTRYVQSHFTAVQDYDVWPQAANHTQWPGNGSMGDRYFDSYYQSGVPFPYEDDPTYQELSVQQAGVDLLDRIGHLVVLIAHSQGGPMPWLIADSRPNLVRSIVALEPTGPPFMNQVFDQAATRPYGLSNAPLTFEPAVKNNIDPRSQFSLVTTNSTVPSVGNCTLQLNSTESNPRRLVNLMKIPVAVLTSQASYHAVYDWCTVEFLIQAGVETHHLSLEKYGLYGNAHLFFLEDNSDAIAELVKLWIEHH